MLLMNHHMAGCGSPKATMSKHLILCLVSLLLLAPLQAQQPKQDKKILKNADVVMMVQNHFDDETLIKVIDISTTDFDVSEDALVDLMKQGVSSPVLKAMLASAHKQKAIANHAATAENSTPTAPVTAPASAVQPDATPAQPAD